MTARELPDEPRGGEGEPGAGMPPPDDRRTAPMPAFASLHSAAPRPADAADRGPSDLELVARVRGGDEGAFRALVDRHRQRIFALCHRILRDPEDAEDAAQEAFVKAYRRLDSFRGDSQLYTWLYRIATNVANDHYQARRRRRSVEGGDSETLQPPRVDDPDRPDRAAERADLKVVARRALDKLPPLFRTVLILREYEGLEYRDIAETLNIELGTVMSRLFRARLRFKNAVEQLFPEFRDDRNDAERLNP